MIRYRRRQEGEATPEVQPKHWHEAVFVGVPLAFFLLWFAIGYPQYVETTQPPPGAMDVFVQGKKWMWKFAYPGGPSSLDVLRVPAGRPVRLLITSRDVIHSFFVPDLRLKQDALPGPLHADLVPGRAARPLPGLLRRVLRPLPLRHAGRAGGAAGGRVRRVDRRPAARRGPGPGRRAQRGRAAMPGSSILDQGRRVAADQGCLKCHSVDGSRHIGPTFIDLYGRQEKLTTGEVITADEAYLTRSMMDPAAQLVAGYQNVMPSFQGRMTPPEVAAVVEYIKSLKTPAVTAGPSEGPVYEPTPRK